jgi:signal transduction histidine kinase
MQTGGTSVKIVDPGTRRVPQPGELPVNILIVDDEPRNLTVLETVLDDPGYRLVRATSGEQALLELMATEFAVLVLDVRMPGMTGFELAQMIRERKKTAHVPIIFLTAFYNEDQHVLEGYDRGAVDYLHKPVNPAVLRSKVSVFAAMHRNGRALELANRLLQSEITERLRAEAHLNELTQSLDRQVIERTDALEASHEQLRDAARRKDEFLATLAHELRNPLAPVRNAVQVLRLNGFENPRSQWASELIDRQVGAMSRLIDDLMDVSRINQGKIQLHVKRLQLRDILNDAVETSRPVIDEYGHHLHLSLAPDPLWVAADPTRLAQAFMNLLNNAAKYTEPGGRIDVSVRVADGAVAVSVTDSGIGIPVDRLDTIFEMFSQIETTLSRSRGGLGIGLSLTRRLVEMHGGSVEARSKGAGHGSEFIVRLPIVREESATTGGGQDVTRQAIAPSAPDSLRILVADDNRDAAESLTAMLELYGHHVRTVHDGEAAVGAAFEFQPQVILLDIGMPKLNGYEVCRRLRSTAAGADMTVIAITGWSQPTDHEMSRKAGFDHHLVKPVDPAAVVTLISKVASGQT